MSTAADSLSFRDEQRLAFGSVAELYDRARPSYPMGAIDDVITHAGLTAGDTVLEVGAGTGKATVMLAARGLGVVALEPSAAMAAVARANCRELHGVRVIESEFESWKTTERFAALVSVQAWHWIGPEVRYKRAHDALVAGGTLAAVWTFPDWEACALRDALADVYRLVAPHSSVEYGELLQTHQDHILLAPDERRLLLAALAAVIADEGAGTVTMPFVTRVCLATRR